MIDELQTESPSLVSVPTIYQLLDCNQLSPRCSVFYKSLWRLVGYCYINCLKGALTEKEQQVEFRSKSLSAQRESGEFERARTPMKVWWGKESELRSNVGLRTGLWKEILSLANVYFFFHLKTSEANACFLILKKSRCKFLENWYESFYLRFYCIFFMRWYYSYCVVIGEEASSEEAIKCDGSIPADKYLWLFACRNGLLASAWGHGQWGFFNIAGRWKSLCIFNYFILFTLSCPIFFV